MIIAGDPVGRRREVATAAESAFQEPAGYLAGAVRGTSVDQRLGPHLTADLGQCVGVFYWMHSTPRRSRVHLVRMSGCGHISEVPIRSNHASLLRPKRT